MKPFPPATSTFTGLCSWVEAILALKLTEQLTVFKLTEIVTPPNTMQASMLTLMSAILLMAKA